MKTVMERVGVGLQRVVIRELRENTYYASIVLLWDGEEVEIDSRPSDAIALAVRFGQPIFVSRTLLEGQTALDLRGVRGAPLSVGGVTVQVLSAEMAEYFDLPAGQGVVVADVAAAADDGLRRGDVILEVDGEPGAATRPISAPSSYAHDGSCRSRRPARRCAPPRRLLAGPARQPSIRPTAPPSLVQFHSASRPARVDRRADVRER